MSPLSQEEINRLLDTCELKCNTCGQAPPLPYPNTAMYLIIQDYEIHEHKCLFFCSEECKNIYKVVPL